MSVLSTTNTTQLNEMMKDVSYFRGCYSQDWCQGKTPMKEEYLVLNLDRRGGKGTHWVCVCNHPDSNLIEYFDSFGLPAPEKILSYMKRSGKTAVSTTNEIQHLKSEACGYYCVAYLTLRSKGVEPYDILYHFTLDDGWENEEKLRKKIERIIKDEKESMEGGGIERIASRLLNKSNYASILADIVGRFGTPVLRKQVQGVLGSAGIRVGGLSREVRHGLDVILRGANPKAIWNIIAGALNNHAPVEVTKELLPILKDAFPLTGGRYYENWSDEDGFFSDDESMEGDGFNVGLMTGVINKRLIDQGFTMREIKKVRRNLKKNKFFQENPELVPLRNQLVDEQELITNDYETKGASSDYFIGLYDADRDKFNELVKKKYQELLAKRASKNKSGEVREQTKTDLYREAAASVSHLWKKAKGKDSMEFDAIDEDGKQIRVTYEGRKSNPEVMGRLNQILAKENVAWPKVSGRRKTPYLRFSMKFAGFGFREANGQVPEVKRGSIIGNMWKNNGQTDPLSDNPSPEELATLAAENGYSLVRLPKKVPKPVVTEVMVPPGVGRANPLLAKKPRATRKKKTIMVPDATFIPIPEPVVPFMDGPTANPLLAKRPRATKIPRATEVPVTPNPAIKNIRRLASELSPSSAEAVRYNVGSRARNPVSPTKMVTRSRARALPELMMDGNGYFYLM